MKSKKLTPTQLEEIEKQIISGDTNILIGPENVKIIGDVQTQSKDVLAKSNIHEDICKFIHNLYITKNMDYGDSMHPLFEEYGLTAFLVMFSIKINRIKSLMNKDKANYESLEDSLMDLANYALIALTELRYKSKNK